MADGLENSMTFYFGAEDRASEAATNAEKIVEAAGESMENTLLSMTTATEQITEAAGSSIGSLADVVKYAKDKVEIAQAPIMDIAKSLRSVRSELKVEQEAAAMGAAFSELGTTLDAVAGGALQELSEHRLKQLSAGPVSLKTLTNMTTAWGKALDGLKRSFTAVTSVGGTLIATLSVVARTAGKSLASVGGALDVGKIAGGALGAGGGLLSALLGPIGPIMKLLEPLISLISDMLAPAIDAIGSAVETAFAPFAYVVEEVAMGLRPLIVKGLQPVVALMTRLALEVGKVFSGKTSGAMSKATAMFLRISQSVGELARKILPVAIGLFEKIVPFAEKIGESLGELAMRIIPVLGSVFEKVGPLMVDTFGKLLDAVAPLIPPLTELAAVLIEKVFGPLLISSLQGVLELVQELLPYVQAAMPSIVEAIKYVSDAVSDFFGNFTKYMTQFRVLFGPSEETIKKFGAVMDAVFGPIVEYIGKLVDGAKTLLKLMPSTAEVSQEAVDKAAKESLGAGITEAQANNAKINEADTNREFQRRLAAGESVADLVAKQRSQRAEGGVVKGRADVTVGERGEEVILPRTAEAIEGFVRPVLSAVELPSLPGLEQASMWLQRIYERLNSPLSVRGDRPEHQQREAVERDMGTALGMSGLSV